MYKHSELFLSFMIIIATFGIYHMNILSALLYFRYRGINYHHTCEVLVPLHCHRSQSSARGNTGTVFHMIDSGFHNIHLDRCCNTNRPVKFDLVFLLGEKVA